MGSFANAASIAVVDKDTLEQRVEFGYEPVMHHAVAEVGGFTP